MTGHGGWPMTSFLTADGRAVLLRHLLAATERAAAACRRSGRCSSRSRETWQTRRDEVEQAGRDVVAAALAAAPARQRAEVTAELLDQGLGGAARGLRRRARRLRRRAEVPAVDGAGVPAAARTPAPARGSRWSSTPASAMARGGMYDQLGRRLRALLRRRAVGRAALREDALRQRPAAAGLRALWRATGSAARPAGRAGDRRLPAARPAHRRGRLRLRARRRHRRRRGPDLRLDAGAAASRCSARTTARWAAELLDVTAAGPSSTAPSVLQRLLEPDDPERYARVRGGCCAARGAAAAAGPRRQGRRRLERPRRRRARRGAARCSTGPTGSRRRTRAPPAALAALGRRAGCGGSPATASSGRTPGCSRTTPTSPRGCSRSTGRPATPVARRRARPARGRADAVRGRRGRLLRHRRRRRGAGPPAAGPDRQRDARRGVGRCREALLTYAALTGSDRHRRRAEQALATLAPLFGRHARFAGWALAVGRGAARRAGRGRRARPPRPARGGPARRRPGRGGRHRRPARRGARPGAAYVCRGFALRAAHDRRRAAPEQLGARAGTS